MYYYFISENVNLVNLQGGEADGVGLAAMKIPNMADASE